jgi:hypothetical protein
MSCAKAFEATRRLLLERTEMRVDDDGQFTAKSVAAPFFLRLAPKHLP